MCRLHCRTPCPWPLSCACPTQVAADELLREGLAQGAVAVPGDVGVAVEVALFQASGGLTRDYKAKFRSLVFNLKDVANPDLRARVLQVRARVCACHLRGCSAPALR